jgi:hypothetical protein
MSRQAASTNSLKKPSRICKKDAALICEELE